MANRNVTLQAAAERLGVTASTLADWCRRHGAPSDPTKDPHGRVLYWLVDVAEIRRWRKGRKHGNLGKRRTDVVDGGAA
jgi:hypothetical protein